MKALIILSLLCLCIFSSCSKEKGCTNAEAWNYSETAEKDDGTCKFNGTVSFYTTKCTAVDNPGEEITIYVGGSVLGKISSCFPVTGSPAYASPCDDQAVNWQGTFWTDYADKTGSYVYTAYDIDTTNSWSGSFNLNAKTSICLELQ